MYTTDLFDITITPACHPRDGFKITFVESTPYKSQVQKALDMTVDELKKAVKKAAADEDEVAKGDAEDELQRAIRAREIVTVASLEHYAVEAPFAVVVAGTQIGVIKIEQREVWKTY